MHDVFLIQFIATSFVEMHVAAERPPDLELRPTQERHFVLRDGAVGPYWIAVGTLTDKL